MGMQKASGKLNNKAILFVVIIWVLGGFSSADASPPACHRGEASMYIHSDVVVEAVVIQSRRWSQGTTLHLVAKYKIKEVFKGDVHKDEILIVTDTCHDEPVPRGLLGYPVVEDYCRGGIGLNLTGVNPGDGTPFMKSGERPTWILFLKKDFRKGAPQLTWRETSRTSFSGGCWQNRDDIPPDQREQFDRLQQMREDIKNR